MENDLEIPIKEACENEQAGGLLSPLGHSACGSCGGKSGTCGAVRHIEDLSHDVDVLRAELRRCEKTSAEDTRRLWFKLGGLIVALGALLPTGWATFLGLI